MAPPSWVSRFTSQSRALTAKNLRLLARRRGTLTAIAASPLLFLGALVALWSSLSLTDTRLQSLSVSRCSSYGVYGQQVFPPDAPCVTLLYAPSDDPVVAGVVARVAEQAGLVVGDAEDYAGAARPTPDVIGFRTDGEAAAWMLDHITSLVDFVAIFNVTYEPVGVEEGRGERGHTASPPVLSRYTGAVQYSLWLNSSTVQSAALAGADPVWVALGAPGRALAWQAAIDGAIIAYGMGVGGGPHGTGGARDTAPHGLRSGGVAQPAPSGGPGIAVRMAAFSDWEPATVGGTVGSGSSEGVDMMLIAGGAMLCLGLVLMVSLYASFLSGEIHADLKQYMQSNGLLESAYWLSWAVCVVPLALFAAILLPLVGMASGLALFTSTSFLVLFLSFFIAGLALAAQVLCLSAMCLPTQLPANIPACLMVVFALLVTMLSSALNAYPMVYAPNTSPVIALGLYIWPAFHFGRYMQSVIYVVYTGAVPVLGPPALGASSWATTPPPAPLSEEWPPVWAPGVGATPAARRLWDRVQGGRSRRAAHDGNATAWQAEGAFRTAPWRGAAHAAPLNGSTPLDGPAVGVAPSISFTWADVYLSPPTTLIYVNNMPVLFQDYPPGFDLAQLLILTGVYMIGAWYCGHFQGSAQTGGRDKAVELRHSRLFPFDPRYWGLMRPAVRAAPAGDGDTLAEVRRLSSLEGSIRVHKLSKRYGVQGAAALTEVSLVIPPGQLLALLGQNGAGKSTLIHCLLSGLRSTHGEAFVFGHSTQTDASELQALTGCCPQDDLLWEDMTALQHLQLLARLKGVKEEDVEGRCRDMLAQVGLEGKADSRVGPFSGGMKRRLSVAMAAVGDPKLIILDEPSTGLDPISRRGVWDIISRLRSSKPGRIVIVTTHNLAEADALGDAVAILANGRLRAVGTPLFLKTRFGQGYSLQLLVDPSRMAEVRAAVSAHLPGASLVGDVDEASASDSGQYLQATTAPLPTGLLDAARRGEQRGGEAGARRDGRGFFSRWSATSVQSAPLSVGDTLVQPSKRTGAMSIAVPRTALRYLPAFLRWLQAHSDLGGREGAANEGNEEWHDTSSAASAGGGGNALPAASLPLVREWGISNSTLEEVFLRLAGAVAVNSLGGGSELQSAAGLDAEEGGTVRGLGAAYVGVGRGMPPLPHPIFAFPVPPSPAGALSHAHERVEGLPVQGVGAARLMQLSFPVGGALSPLAAPPTSPRGVCTLCLSAAAAPVVLYTSRAVAVVAEDLVCSVCAERELSDILPIRARASGEEPSGVHVRAPTTAGSGRPQGHVPSLLFDDGDQSVPLLADALSSPVNSPPHSEGAKVAVTGNVERPAWSSSVHTPVTGKQVQGAGQEGELQGVSFWAQLGALLKLRVLLVSRLRILAALTLLIVLGASLQIVLAVPPSISSLTLCSGGYYADNTTTALCDSTVFIQTMTGAVSRTDYTPVSDSGPGGSETTGGGAACAAELGAACIESATAASVDADGRVVDDSVPPYAALLYQPYCPSHSHQTGQCSSRANPPDFPLSVDWMQTQQVSAVAVPSTGRSTAVVWQYALPAASTSGAPFLPLVEWDVFGPGAEGVVKTPSGSVVWPWVAELRPVSAAYAGQGVDGIDAGVTAAMQAVFAAATVVANGSCLDNNNGVYVAGMTYGWQWDVSQLEQAADWTANNLPSVALALLAADTTGSAPAGSSAAPQPILAYDLRMWAALCGGVQTWCPTRSNGYVWAGNGAILVNGPELGPDAFVCTEDGLSTPTDWPWYNTFSAPARVPSSASLSAVHNAWYRTVVNANNMTAVLSTPVIRTALVDMPAIGWQAAGPGAAGLSFAPLLWPLFTLFLLPTQSFWMSEEKAKRLFSLMRLSGLRLAPYFVANYLFAFLTGCFVRAVYVGAGVFAGGESFTAAGWLLWAPLVLASAHEQAGWALLLGSAVPSPYASAAVGYVLTLAVSLTSFLVSSFVQPWPRPLTWTPLVCGARAATLVFQYGGDTVDPRDELASALGACVLYGCLAACAALLVHSVLPGPAGHEAGADGVDVAHALRAVWARCSKGQDASSPARDGEYVELRDVTGVGAPGAASLLMGSRVEGDPGVARERARVQAATGQEHALMLASLVKQYRGTPAPSVCGVDLCVEYGTSIGLLGPNGAGKTTTLSMLTGGTGITSGRAVVAGNDVSTSLSRVWRHLGVCPQFDACWDGLSVRQHMEFFSALKGAGQAGQEHYGGGGRGAVRSDRAVAQGMAERVGLDGDPFDTPASSLSGGMRRRLSLAIAMAGCPQLLLLDEPTTGLDPDSKRSIHRIIAQYKSLPGRSVILTTHAMEEADALCDRLAIMAGGRMLAVGTSQALKARYGGGYTLTLTLSAPPGAAQDDMDVIAARALRFVHARVHPHASVRSRVACTMVVDLPTGAGAAELDVATVFAAMQGRFSLPRHLHGGSSGGSTGGSLGRAAPSAPSSSSTRGVAEGDAPLDEAAVGGALIADWGLAQPSLEDVFLRVAGGRH